MVIGDSIAKTILPHKMKNTLGDDRLYAKSFSGATVQDMLDNSKPILRKKPDIIIYHTGTKNLYTDDTPNEIASNIISHALASTKLRGARGGIPPPPPPPPTKIFCP